VGGKENKRLPGSPRDELPNENGSRTLTIEINCAGRVGINFGNHLCRGKRKKIFMVWEMKFHPPTAQLTVKLITRELVVEGCEDFT
jgi:hypothetical protein